jgi:hypothetical protein
LCLNHSEFQKIYGSSEEKESSDEVPSSTQAATTQAPTTQEATKAPVELTTDAAKEAGRSLDLPDSPVTEGLSFDEVLNSQTAEVKEVTEPALIELSVNASPEPTTKASTVNDVELPDSPVTEASSVEPSTTEAVLTTLIPEVKETPVTVSDVIELSFDSSPSTEAAVEPKISIQEVFPTLTKVPASEISLSVEENTAQEKKVEEKTLELSITEVPSTEVPAITEEAKTTNAPTTVPTIPAIDVSPTEFEKLLTTLREFVAKVDATTSTEAPQTTETLQFDKIVEFVNHTVSSESDKVEETKSISKRSVPDADLIPRYFKQHYSTNKDKGCVFNGRSFKLGEPIKTDNECLKCICEFAPIGHCMLKEKCNF